MSKTSVTVLGLGRMGAAIAEVFVRNGHPTTVWNRTPGKAIHLDELGARRTDDVAEAVAAGELIVTVLADTAAAGDQLVPLGAALRGRTVLNVATGRPTPPASWPNDSRSTVRASWTAASSAFRRRWARPRRCSSTAASPARRPNSRR